MNFQINATIVFKEIAKNSVGCSVEALWRKLENHLRKKIHQAALQKKFFGPR